MMTKRLLATARIFMAALLTLGANLNCTGASVRLWQIGQADTNNSDFALAPNQFGKFKMDGLFVVGQSQSSRDWPYVHPGPDDAWAGSRPHPFTILFALKSQLIEGQCLLRLALLDTHNQTPPKLRVQINGQIFEQSLPRGNGDESIAGAPEKGRPHQIELKFASKLLQPGDNEIQITSVSGSWILYDAISLEVPEGTELTETSTRTIVATVEPVRAVVVKNGEPFQPVNATLRHFGSGENVQMQVGDGSPKTIHLAAGETTVEALTPAVTNETTRSFVLKNAAGIIAASRPVVLKPVPKLSVYVLPHSHTDIGYTEIQTAVEKRQMNNLLLGMDDARQTAKYPTGAKFVWNVEVLWAADMYLRQFSPEKKERFLAAVKGGEVALNGAYLNELTGLCRPEELVRLFRFAGKISGQTGIPIDSVMISDVPGYTWGTVTAMAQAGIKYFSAAPNNFDRIGTILRDWENKPFYWVAPNGKSKVLVWIPFWGYALSHRYWQMSPRLVDDFYDSLKLRNYPYEIAYLRWSGHGDNGAPDRQICEFVKDWNAKYQWPKFIISGTSEAFRALEQRHGKELPQIRGDWTPYWEDGAGSSARETAINRASSDRLVQAETLYAMFNRRNYPTETFGNAWRNVLLYSEHTWGADCSISQPESQKTREQWEIKQRYVTDADKASRTLIQTALETDSASAKAENKSVDVYNTLSWPRTELALLAAAHSSDGDRVTDAQGKLMPSQRLNSGELAFIARDIPPLAGRRLTVGAGSSFTDSPAAIARGAVLENGLIRVRMDEKTGGIVELTAKGIEGNFVDTSGGESLNDYLYLPGDNVAELKRNGPARIRVGEKGPLVASLIVESTAPGCKGLRRELRLVAGADYIELINLVDKERLQAASYHSKEGKESVNFAFPFNIPNGEMLLDIPFGVMNPVTDQIAGSCKNWFTVGRWLDISNEQRGITWVTLDAPLVELGGITANLLNSQTDPNVWRKEITRTQKFYSWAMNNHWGTNYRAYQHGPTVFRFILRPHRGSTPAVNTRFATAFSHPLVIAPAGGASPAATPFLGLDSTDVIVTALKPSDDGKALIVRLFDASGKGSNVNLNWSSIKPKSIWLSNTAELAVSKVQGRVAVPSWGLVTLRAELE